MTNWREFKLEDVATVQTGPFGSQLHQSDYVENGTPIITVEHLGDNRITRQNLPKVTDYDKERLKRYHLQEGDVVFSRVGSVDRRALVTKKEDGWLFSGRCLRVRADEKLANGAFLSYYFGQENFKEYIRRIAVGATMPSINTKILSEIVIKIPDLPTQTIIAEILSSLDDKIELNNKINQELENLAQNLFKQWFINFEFPNENGEPYKSSGGEMVESELGEIPKGWEVKTFADVAQVIDCLHSKKPIIFNDSTGYLFLQLSNIKDNGLLDLTQKFWISKEDYQKWIARIEVKEGDFVITNVGRSGAVSRIGKGVKAAIGRNMTALRLKDNFQFNGFFSVLILSDFMKKEINSKLDSGTILDALNVKNIPKLRFTFPLKLELPIEFETIVRPIWDRMEMNLIENNSLIDTRGYLLPKLISGELEVSQTQTTA